MSRLEADANASNAAFEKRSNSFSDVVPAGGAIKADHITLLYQPAKEQAALARSVQIALVPLRDQQANSGTAGLSQDIRGDGSGPADQPDILEKAVEVWIAQGRRSSAEAIEQA